MFLLKQIFKAPEVSYEPNVGIKKDLLIYRSKQRIVTDITADPFGLSLKISYVSVANHFFMKY